MYGFVRLNAPVEDPDPFSSIDYRPSATPLGLAIDDGSEPIELGIDPLEWERLLAGESLRDLVSEEGRVEVRIRFLIRTSARMAYDLLVDPDNLVELYDDVEAAEVKKRFRGENASYDTVWFRGRSGPYKLEYCLRRDYVLGRSIRWKLVHWPGTSTLLKSCRGGWFFQDVGRDGLTLLDYRNQIQLPDLPDWLLTRMVEHNLPHTMAVLRNRLESPGE